MNIELYTLSEVEEVSGEEGNFTVKIKKHPRYVDMDKCIACGLCSQKCPKKVDDEFNMGISKRKAIYIKYGQTVPLKYAIDPEHCLYLTRGRCRACEKFCPTGAINFDDKEEIITVQVGSIILAPGYKTFDPSKTNSYGYNDIPDVVTSLEYERLLSASGPCLGHLVRPSDGKEPKRIAWMQCVGSRSIREGMNSYCSSVCCMYAIKQAMVTAEHLSGEGLEQTIFYMDIRTHGKEFERYYEDAKKKGIRFVKVRPYTFWPGKNNIGVVVSYIDTDGTRVTEEYDMAVLSVGLESCSDAEALATKLQFRLNRHKFVETDSFHPVSTTRKGIYVAGAFQSPKAIPRSVAEASAAAAEASSKLARARGTLTKEKTYPPERNVANEEPRIGVFVCSCGINIANVVDVNEVLEYSKTLPYVVYAENNLFTCSTDTQDLIAEKIKEHKLNRVVIAACTPRTHEPLFQDTLREAGLNPYLIEMANIRNQNSWVHMKDPARATEKAKDQVRMAVAKVALNYPLERMGVKVVQKALVVGGGLSGMTAALGLAEQGYETFLLEKGETLGGNAWCLNETWKGEDIRKELVKLINAVEGNPRITVYKNATLKSCKGSVGNFVSEVDVAGNIETISYGIAVIATGGQEYKPKEYQYDNSDRIMTHLEFDLQLREEKDRLKEAQSVAFIQCVGSREEERPYCSRVCCTHSIKSAIELKELNPSMDVYILYRDIRTYGEREDLYREARDRGVLFIHYDVDKKPEVSVEGDSISLKVFDTVLERCVKLSPDYLVLASAILPNDNSEIIDLFKCGTNEDGFLNEAHPKLRPVDMPVDGLFLAGLCHYPKPVDEAIAQAKAAVARAGVILAKDVMQLDAIKAQVTEDCDGCALCVDACPYQAISIREYEANGRRMRIAETDKALCKGCGVCEATCPKGGILVHGFTNDQLKAEIDAILEVA